MLLLTSSRQNKRIHFRKCLDTWKHTMLLDHACFVLSKRETFKKQRFLCCLFSWHTFKRLIIMDHFRLIAISITIDMCIICCLSYSIHDFHSNISYRCTVPASPAMTLRFNSKVWSVMLDGLLDCTPSGRARELVKFVNRFVIHDSTQMVSFPRFIITDN